MLPVRGRGRLQVLGGGGSREAREIGMRKAVRTDFLKGARAPDGLHHVGRIPGGKAVGRHVVSRSQQASDDRPGRHHLVLLEHGEEAGDDAALEPETLVHIF
jgi:hypothetical protein